MIPFQLITLTHHSILINNLSCFRVDEEKTHELAIVNHLGQVLWAPRVTFRGLCPLDLRSYPFDHQECEMWFGSWTYSARDFTFKLAFPQGLDLSTYQPKHGAKWSMNDGHAEARHLPSLTGNPDYVFFVVTLKLQRRITLNAYLLTIPAIFMAMITWFIFLLPRDRSIRIITGKNDI